VDNQLPAALTQWLARNGWDATHVLDLHLNEADDLDIWKYARDNGFVVISKDEDFSNRAALSRDVQIIWVRLGNCRNQFLIEVFEKNIGSLVSALQAGTVVVELWGP
jgi:predicted nuclease of predicted toxin-antitoxin system